MCQSVPISKYERCRGLRRLLNYHDSIQPLRPLFFLATAPVLSVTEALVVFTQKRSGASYLQRTDRRLTETTGWLECQHLCVWGRKVEHRSQFRTPESRILS